MLYDEYKDQILSLIKDPDTALTKVDGVLEALKGDLETKTTLEAKNKEQEDRIRTLQDTNMQLFLRASGEVEKEPEPEPEKTFEEQFDALAKEE